MTVKSNSAPANRGELMKRRQST